ncbi:MAG TPA: alanine racemase [Phycisphaerae bacterium]|nr:alanine racemase [Phycisphaerae bacterium]
MIPQSGELRISTQRLGHNIAAFRKRLPQNVKISAIVKANAYGHSLAAMTPLFKDAGVDWLCVYSLEEAGELLGLNSQLPILVLAPLATRGAPFEFSAAQLRVLESDRVRVTLTDADSALALAAWAAKQKLSRQLNVHVQIDTGLTRHGVSPSESRKLLADFENLPSLALEGIFMHFSHGEAPNHPVTAAQLGEFERITKPLKEKNPKLIRHAQNSGGTWNVSDAALDMVRLGIAIYGLQPSLAHPIKDLQPIARLVAPIAAIHQRSAGVGVGYSHIFTTKRPSRLAVIPVGYADGYPRHLSNRGSVEFSGALLPVVGRVSMDQIVADVTDSTAKVGDVVTLISDDPNSPICMDRLAERCGTIGYELATRMGPRLVRKIV